MKPLPSMKPLRLVVAALAAASLVSVASSCGLFQTGPRRIRFVVALDSIVVPDTVKSTDTLFVGLRGVIAYDGCAQYDGMTRSRNGGDINYTVYALHDDGRICVQTLILLNRVDTVPPPQVNPTTIRAVQPKGAFPVSRTVVVQ